MIQSKRSITITSSSIVIYLVFLGSFKPYLIPASAQQILRFTCILIGLLYVVCNYKTRNILNPALVISCSVTLSCLYNYYYRTLTSQNLLNGLFFSLNIYVIYSLMLTLRNKGLSHRIIRCLYRISTIYSIISTLSVFFVEASRTPTFFFGSKYMTCYLFMLNFALYYVNHEQDIKSSDVAKIKYVSLALVFVILIWKTGCITGLLGFVLLVILGFANDCIRGFLSKPYIAVLLMSFALLILLILDAILSIGMIQKTIVLLGKDIGLTDRMRYYSRAMSVLSSGSQLWGYGYASDEMRSNIALGSNLQNGLLQHLASYGIIGLISLFVTVVACFKNKRNRCCCWGFYMLFYALVFTSIVEVSYNLVFFMVLFMIGIFPDKNSYRDCHESIFEKRLSRNSE